MTVRSVSYLDLSPAQRQRGAAVARERLRANLTNPLLTDDQKKQIHTEMLRLDYWEKGNDAALKKLQSNQ